MKKLLLMFIIGMSFAGECLQDYYYKSFDEFKKYQKSTNCSVNMKVIDFQEINLEMFKYVISTHPPVHWKYMEGNSNDFYLNFNTEVANDPDKLEVLLKKGYPQENKYGNSVVENSIFLSNNGGVNARQRCGEKRHNVWHLFKSIARFGKKSGFSKSIPAIVQTGDYQALINNMITVNESISFKEYCNAVGVPSDKNDTLVLKELVRRGLINTSYEITLNLIDSIYKYKSKQQDSIDLAEKRDSISKNCIENFNEKQVYGLNYGKECDEYIDVYLIGGGLANVPVDTNLINRFKNEYLKLSSLHFESVGKNDELNEWLKKKSSSDSVVAVLYDRMKLYSFLKEHEYGAGNVNWSGFNLDSVYRVADILKTIRKYAEDSHNERIYESFLKEKLGYFSSNKVLINDSLFCGSVYNMWAAVVKSYDYGMQLVLDGSYRPNRGDKFDYRWFSAFTKQECEVSRPSNYIDIVLNSGNVEYLFSSENATCDMVKFFNIKLEEYKKHYKKFGGFAEWGIDDVVSKCDTGYKYRLMDEYCTNFVNDFTQKNREVHSYEETQKKCASAGVNFRSMYVMLSESGLNKCPSNYHLAKLSELNQDIKNKEVVFDYLNFTMNEKIDKTHFGFKRDGKYRLYDNGCVYLQFKNNSIKMDEILANKNENIQYICRRND